MMTYKNSEGFKEDWVPSYVETMESLYGPLVEEQTPSIEEINEVLINNFIAEPQDPDQGLSRWINLYLALLDFVHGFINTEVVPSIESINQQWIECFFPGQEPAVDVMTKNWISAYLDLQEILQAKQETIMPIEAINQEWIRCFYTVSTDEDFEFEEGWAISYLASNEELHGTINLQSGFSIDELNAEWIRLFREDSSSTRKNLAKVA